MPKIIALLGLACACSALIPAAYADTSPSGTQNQPAATIIPAPIPADPATLAVIQQDNDDLAAAEKTAVFGDYKKEIVKITSPDFDFTDLGHTAYNLETFLKGEQGVMADTTAVSSDTWKVDEATKSTVDNSIDVTATRYQASTDHDIQGYFGAKGLTHQLTSNGTVWEHWIKTTGGQWVMDDMALRSVKMTVDGKVWTPPAPKAPPATKKPAAPKAQSRSRSRTITGGNNDVF